MAEGVTRYAVQRVEAVRIVLGSMVGNDEPSLDGVPDEDLGGAIMVEIDDAQIHALREFKRRGCPHACLPPCPFHRAIDEQIKRLGDP